MFSAIARSFQNSIGARNFLPRFPVFTSAWERAPRFSRVLELRIVMRNYFRQEVNLMRVSSRGSGDHSSLHVVEPSVYAALAAVLIGQIFIAHGLVTRPEMEMAMTGEVLGVMAVCAAAPLTLLAAYRHRHRRH